MEGIARRIAEEYSETNEGVGVWTQSYEDFVMPQAIVSVLWVMLGAVFGVLLIASFNVANLLLARAAVRSKEIAVRSALGADRGRLIRQLLLEASVLAALGGVAGVVLGYLGIEAFNQAIIDIEKPYWIDIRLDAPALLFSFGITAFASLVAGTLPAIRASGGKIHEILQDESRGSSSFRMGRFSAALVIGEIALSCGLLVGAGMMIKSVINLKSVDMGFDGEQLFTARLGLFESDYPDDESRRRFFDRLLEDLRSAPGAEAAGLTVNLPALGSARARIALQGVAYPELRDRPLSNFTSITPGYLNALGVDILEGRDFGLQDRADEVPTVIVNESFAQKHFGGESPLERRFRRGDEQPWMTIVGVVPDIYVGGSGGGGIGSSDVMADQFFMPLAQQQGVRFISLLVKTRDDPGGGRGRISIGGGRDRPGAAPLLGSHHGGIRGIGYLGLRYLRLVVHDFRRGGALLGRGGVVWGDGLFSQSPNPRDGRSDGSRCRRPRRDRACARQGHEAVGNRCGDRAGPGCGDGTAHVRHLLRRGTLGSDGLCGHHPDVGAGRLFGVPHSGAARDAGRASGRLETRLRYNAKAPVPTCNGGGDRGP